MNSLTAEVQPFQALGDANFQFKIANYGDTPNYSTLVKVIIDGAEMGIVNIGTINNGYEYTFTLTISGVSEGTHEIKLIAVPTAGDSNLNNNSISKNFVWQGVPDLVVNSFETVSGETKSVVGQPVEFIFTVTNQGTGMAEGVINNHIIINDQELYIISTSNLDVGYTLTGRFTVTFNERDLYVVQLNVNKNHSIIESNYDNNTGAAIVICSHLLSEPWNSSYQTATFQVQDTFSDLTKSQISDAITHWNAQLTKPFLYKSSVDTTATDASYNGVKTITEKNYGENGGAIATCHSYLTDSLVVECDITCNTYYAFANSAQPDAYDIQSIITHELGHVLGVDHSITIQDTMYAYAKLNSIENRTVTSADKNAARYSTLRWFN